MTIERPTEQLVTRLLAPAFRFLEHRGHDPRAALAAVGLDPEILTDPDRRIADTKIGEFLDHGANITGDVDFGIHAGEHFRPGDYGLLEVLIGQAGGHDTMTALVNQYHPLLGGSARQPVETRGDVVVFVASDPNHLLSRTAAEYTVVSGLGLARLILGRYYIVTWASFMHDHPADIAEHNRVIAAELRFGAAENAIAFPVESHPQVSSAVDPSLVAWLADEATARLERLAAPTAAVDRVRAVLHAASGQGFSASAVAYQLAVSERTLRRQLEAEGTTFAAVRDEVRRAESSRLLTDTDQAIVDIAVNLGYGDSSGFHRAFRRWTGSTPAAFRAGRPSSQIGR